MLAIILLIAVFFLKTTDVSASSVTINEFMANPTLPATEWVEFYNPAVLDLTTYWIDDDLSFIDDSGNSSKKSLSSINSINTTYPYIELSSSIFNNSGDYVVLFNNSGEVVDQYRYTSDPGKDISIDRSPDGGSWTTLSTSSKGSSNGGISSTPSPTPTTTQSPTSTPSPTSSSNPSLFTISNTPSQINADQQFSALINLTLPDKPNTNFYLKGAFKKADSSNYFGYTKVGSDWIKNSSTYTNQYKITTDSSGNWSGYLEVKPDFEDSGYTGTDDYIFKVGRYKESDNPSVIWSNEVVVKINSVQANNEDESVTTTASSVKPSPSSPLKTSKTSTQAKNYDRLEYHSASVGGTFATSTSSATLSAQKSNSSVKVKSSQSFNLNIWIILGAILILSGIGFLVLIYLRNKKTQ